MRKLMTDIVRITKSNQHAGESRESNFFKFSLVFCAVLIVYFVGYICTRDALIGGSLINIMGTINLMGTEHSSMIKDTSIKIVPGIVLRPYRRMTSTSVRLEQSILDCLTNGRWVGNNSTDGQKKKIKIFLRKTRDQYGMPNPLQRHDNRCGNLNFGRNLEWFRAVCDPYMSTQCCYHGRCESRAEKDCRCDGCYDLRQRLDAELSEWKAENPLCQVKTHTREEACDILGEADILFIGDSHMRHMYMGLQVVLTGNDVSGCMKENVKQDILSQCLGVYMFTEKICRKYIISAHTLCGGRVRIRLAEFHASRFSSNITRLVSEMGDKPISMVVIGLGHHYSFDSSIVISRISSPILKLLNNATGGVRSPKLLWVGVHSLGLLKTPTMRSQQNAHVVAFNKEMRTFLQTNAVPFMDSFNLTKNIASPDGSHYGRGANVLKTRVFLNYMSALR